MKRTLFQGIAAGALVTVIAAGFSPVVSSVSAQSTTSSQTFQASLSQLNKSGASGTSTITLNGNNVTVAIRATGLSPNQAHAQHIRVGGQAICPAPAADTNKDGYVDAKEAEPFTGPIRISLTTSGDMSAASALAVDRMPKADAKGVLTYDRTFALPSGTTAADMAKATVVEHGISTLFNDKAKYDGDKKSELDSKLPFEATALATCGKLTASPTGGAATGVGSISGIESPALFVAGAVAIVGAGAAAIIARKQLANRQ